ncbi:hypothetical protein DSL72_003880 [Monilinia vaccinii-corymbosi]|uniref:N-acetyltransferase domain-containing protein n=1 Tax=Monilinia vaccinii-corymbosi TaxID=61207 RepID=A0A8A3P2G9_9HELO|nr:hypothetical protein DSL72_003880 [Monilinia vaccinii-corymbosi]
MLINEHTGNLTPLDSKYLVRKLTHTYPAISTNKVLLVPYEESHVITYHEWMKDEEIQKATASEPLSLAEEYAMQRTWRTDADKLTFIICAPAAEELGAVHAQSHRDGVSVSVAKGVADAPGNMVGDVNLFLAEDGNEEGGVVGEIEIMIAEAGARGKGLGRAATLAFVEYLRRHWEEILKEYRFGVGGGTEEGITKSLRLRVKIGGKNLASIGLFESIGFVRVGKGENYFGEVELVFQGWSGEERVGGLMRRFGVEGWRECVYG